MLTTWKEINDLTESDNDFVVTIGLGYGNVFIVTKYGDNFKCSDLRQADHQYDIEEVIKNTIERHKRELKEEY